MNFKFQHIQKKDYHFALGIRKMELPNMAASQEKENVNLNKNSKQIEFKKIPALENYHVILTLTQHHLFNHSLNLTKIHASGQKRVAFKKIIAITEKEFADHMMN